MANSVSLSEVCAALETASPDRAFVTLGQVTEVHRKRGSCYFTLAPSSGSGQGGGDVRLLCALLRQNAARTDFWVTVGQVVEVEGYAEQFRGRWQLYVVEARLVQGDQGWPAGYRYRSARRVVEAFDALDVAPSSTVRGCSWLTFCEVKSQYFESSRFAKLEHLESLSGRSNFGE